MGEYFAVSILDLEAVLKRPRLLEHFGLGFVEARTRHLVYAFLVISSSQNSIITAKVRLAVGS